jgi:hypothetical protein
MWRIVAEGFGSAMTTFYPRPAIAGRGSGEMNGIFKSLNLWKLAITRLLLNCLIVGGTAYTTSMSGIKWSSLDGDQKFMVIIGVVIVIASNIQAFLDKTISRVQEGRSAFETGTTQFIERPKV